MELNDCDCIDQQMEEELDKKPQRKLDLPEGVPPLRSFYLYMSTSCNLACKHCWITPKLVDGKPDPGETIDFDDLKAAVAVAKPMGLAGAKLTGGEPLLHPRFRDIADMLTAEGLSLNMETNGVLLTAELAKHLKENTNVSFISISLDAANAKDHDKFRGVEGAFEGALRGLDNLREAGYTNSQVIMCIHRGNKDQLEDVVKLAAEHGASSVKINVIMPAGRAKAMEEKGETMSFEERMEFTRFVKEELQPRSPLKLVMLVPHALRNMKELWDKGAHTGDCGVKGIMGILGNGDLAMCGIGRTIPELSYGKLDGDIRDIWLNHPTLKQLRQELDDHAKLPGICGECIHGKNCRSGCVAHNYLGPEKLVWPGALCQDADDLGKFPATRKK